MGVHRVPRADPVCPEGLLAWTCLTTIHHFAGCCRSNPCHNDGICPDDDVKPSTTTTTTTTTTAAHKNVNTHTRNPTEWYLTPTATVSPSDSKSSPQNTPAIIGGTIGGFVVLLLLGAAWYLLRNRHAASPPPSPSSSAATATAASSITAAESLPLKLVVPPPLSPAYSPVPNQRTSMQKYGYIPPLPTHYPQEGAMVYAELPTARMEPVELPGDIDVRSPFLAPEGEAEGEYYGASRSGGAHERHSEEHGSYGGRGR